MPNRSIFPLPSVYAPAPMTEMTAEERPAHALDIFDITFLHFHSTLELGFCASGRGKCLADGKEYSFSAGDVQIIFPFQNHLNRSEGPESSRWYWLNTDPIRQLGEWGAPGLAHLKMLLETRMGLCGILDRARYPFPAELIRRIVLPGEKDRRFACLYTLIEELAEASCGLPLLSLRPGRQFTRLEPALECVRRALERGEIPSVSAMAESCALSPAPFRRAFHQALGQSPRQYIQACQLRKAQQLLLLTDLSITQIALAVGYQDVSGFNRQFLSAFGMPPRAYRAMR